MTEAYRVLAGLNYPGKRVEAGEVVSDIPKSSIPWLLESGVIELASAKPRFAVPPPVDNDHIAPGIEPFSDEVIALNRKTDDGVV